MGWNNRVLRVLLEVFERNKKRADPIPEPTVKDGKCMAV
jgi:hypothetical protein